LPRFDGSAQWHVFDVNTGLKIFSGLPGSGSETGPQLTGALLQQIPVRDDDNRRFGRALCKTNDEIRTNSRGFSGSQGDNGTLGRHGVTR
jgi:hypothetical protein